MADELEAAMARVAERIGKFAEDLSTLTVETKYVVVARDGDADFTQAKPIAKTEMTLDGDANAILPLRNASEGQLELDNALLELHQRNVSAAIEYRARILNALVETLRSLQR
jgi:hypothetical protein